MPHPARLLLLSVAVAATLAACQRAEDKAQPAAPAAAAPAPVVSNTPVGYDSKTPYATVIDPAMVPTRPVRPHKIRNLLLAIGLGLVVGIAAAFGREPVITGEGGSIPVVGDFARVLGAPVLLMGFGLPGENAHAPDEWLSDENFTRGMRAAAMLWDELAVASSGGR